MSYKLSRYGQKYTADSGIISLMDDLGSALFMNPDMLMLGGGTPARISAAETVYTKHLQQLLEHEGSRYNLLGRYQGPMGDVVVRELLAQWLSQEYGWKLTSANIVLTNGGQSAFGIIANMLAGDMPDGSRRRIHFPVIPEYLGYTDAGLADNFFSATRPTLDVSADGRFKYRVNFAELQLDEDIGAMCVSRPTNPSGNVLTVEELQQLDKLAGEAGIPLIIDAAYGMPFPGIQFTDKSAFWSENVILLLSMSKLGLPGLRSGFMVASETFTDAFSRANTILNLASGNVGSVLAASMLESGELQRLGADILCPWYHEKAKLAQTLLLDALSGIPCHLHQSEGAFFLWLWLPDLPGGSVKLYQLLKEQGVLVIPGDSAFPGLSEPWQHTSECIRLSFAVDETTLIKAATIIGRVLKPLYGG